LCHISVFHFPCQPSMAAGWHLPLIGGKLGLGVNDAEPFLLSVPR
jgi:hypothetical protein